MAQAGLAERQELGLAHGLSAPAPLCRACGQTLGRPVLDLGMQPLSNSYLCAEQLADMEQFFPLCVRLCPACALVQADAVTAREMIFHGGYQYFSSYSESWLAHAKAYAERMCTELSLSANSFIVEVASNDGYLLRWFAEKKLRVLGIDPARDCALAAERVGVPTTVAFFGKATAAHVVGQHGQADLVAANNVLAHVPDLNDFVGGIAVLLNRQGVATFEFPHLLELVRLGAYDTIYHEHYSYLSILALMPLFERHGLEIFKVEALKSHGGSLRIFVGHTGSHAVQSSVAEILTCELEAELAHPKTYERLADAIDSSRLALFQLLIDAKRSGKKAVAYGAAAKGNTLLNTLGVGSSLLNFVVDRNPQKVGTFMPGSHIPILDVDAIQREKPEVIVVLPWNLSAEISKQLEFTKAWGAQLYRAIPSVEKI
jgi:hypothetical protein